MMEVEDMTVDEVGNNRDYVEFTQNLARGMAAAEELRRLLGRLTRETQGQLETIKVNRNVVPVESEDLCAELDKTVAELLEQLGQVSELVKRSARRRAFLAAAWRAYLESSLLVALREGR